MVKAGIKVVVERYGWLNGGKWAVRLVSGVQSFRLDYSGTKRECLWYARMLRKALGIEKRNAG